jgi:hypothetical protein
MQHSPTPAIERRYDLCTFPAFDQEVYGLLDATCETNTSGPHTWQPNDRDVFDYDINNFAFQDKLCDALLAAPTQHCVHCPVA